MGKAAIIILVALLIVFIWAVCTVSGDESRRKEEFDG